MSHVQIATMKTTMLLRRCFSTTPSPPKPCERNTVIQQNGTHSFPVLLFLFFSSFLSACVDTLCRCASIAEYRKRKRKESTASQNENCKQNTASAHLYSSNKDEDTDAKQRLGANKTCVCHCASEMDIHFSCVYIRVCVGVEVSVRAFLNDARIYRMTTSKQNLNCIVHCFCS